LEDSPAEVSIESFLSTFLSSALFFRFLSLNNFIFLLQDAGSAEEEAAAGRKTRKRKRNVYVDPKKKGTGTGK
tara:strand:- start:114 stop:332 length:219 start_codon:yes stop_codon:yes gene_type:complete